MGLFKNQAKNRKNLRVSVAAKKLKRLFKKKKEDVVMDEDQVNRVVESMEVEEGSSQKKVPIVREGKLRRTALPLVPPPTLKKGAQKTNQKTEAKSDVRFHRPLTKKKARKLLRDKAREERTRQREESKMQQ